MLPVRTAYLDAADAAVGLLRLDVLGARWDDPSVLPDWPTSVLAGHLARSVLQVEWFLVATEPAADSVTAVDYYSALVGVTDPQSALNQGVRARSEETAAAGWATLGADTAACVDRLRARLEVEPPTRRIDAFGRPMLLDEYLRVRLVELSVHGDDLAESLAVPSPIPPGSIDVATDLLVDVARRTKGSLAVLRALTRRERDVGEALRVL
jgi:hypothetical protein